MVGRSGSEKTILVKLLSGPLEPTSGTVLFDGVDMKTLNYRDLRQHIGMVLQDNYVFDGTTPLQDLTATITYEQSFGWGRFGAAADSTFEPLVAPASGGARACYAFAEGLERGYVFLAGEGASLSYELAPEIDRWQARIVFNAGSMPPGTSRHYDYALRITETLPAGDVPTMPALDLPDLRFERVQPSGFKTAPVERTRRVRITDLVADLARPKVRGMNLHAGFPQAFDDLEMLQEWGCNLSITHIREPEKTAEYIARGHALGMEMLLAGNGGFTDGPPDFDAYYARARARAREELPDAHGQDEDHYFWFAIEPALDFAGEMGKPMERATLDDKTVYWAKCFAAKWEGVRRDVAPHAPGKGVWFYAPFPGVAGVDPIDAYPVFLQTLVGELEPGLTVFPFYYGIEYGQAEYMMRAWKDAGAKRAIFLPMRDFMTRPTQFIRAITAARRGGADGACGFAFSISDAPPEKQWQWRAVMLGAWANFPTPDLDAISLMEDPAELVEVLARPGLGIRRASEAPGARAQLHELLAILPDAHATTGPGQAGGLAIQVVEESGNVPAFQRVHRDAGTGLLRMDGDTITLSGDGPDTIAHAWKLLMRFATVARDEQMAP